MKDVQLYEQLLGMQSPWKVMSVQLLLKAGHIVVKVGCQSVAWVCSVTGRRAHIHGYVERKWRHLDSCQYKTFIEAKVPRVKYADGRTEIVAVPWAEGSSRFTSFFERFAIDLLLACSTLAACEILRISWGSVRPDQAASGAAGSGGQETNPPQAHMH